MTCFEQSFGPPSSTSCNGKEGSKDPAKERGFLRTDVHDVHGLNAVLWRFMRRKSVVISGFQVKTILQLSHGIPLPRWDSGRSIDATSKQEERKQELVEGAGAAERWEGRKAGV